MVESMGATSFFGRALFSSAFILSAWLMFNNFGTDGGPLAKLVEPKYDIFRDNVAKCIGVQLPGIEIKYLAAVAIALKGLGSVLFTFGCSIGAYLLLIYLASVTPILHDFYNYSFNEPDFLPVFSEFVQNLALCGALLFFIGMKDSSPMNLKKKAMKTKTN